MVNVFEGGRFDETFVLYNVVNVVTSIVTFI